MAEGDYYLYDVSNDTAAQYWRELQDGLQNCSGFTNISTPVQLLDKIKETLLIKDMMFQKVMAAEKLYQQQSQQPVQVKPPLASPPLTPTDGISKDEISWKNKYQLVLEQKDKIYGHWKTVTDDRDSFKKKYEVLLRERDELSDKLKNTNVQNTALNLVGDKIVKMEKDRDGKWGIKFGCLRKEPLLLESNAIITGVKPGIPNAGEVTVGDFVIEVNGINVQQFPFEDTRELVINAKNLVLKLRPNKRQKAIQKTVDGMKLNPEKGVSLGVFVKTCDPSLKEINEMDEIIKVNSKHVNDLSLKAIYGCMNKNVPFSIIHQTNPYDKFISSHPSRSSISSSASGSTSQDPLSPIGEPPELPTGTYRPPLPRDDTRSSVSSRSSRSSSHNNELSMPSPLGTSNNAFSPDHSLSGGSSEPIGSVNSGEVDDGSGIFTITIEKRDYEEFGWKFIGGNKVGIYIQSVAHWSPIENAKINVGWQILSVNGISLHGVAYCFAMDFLAHLRSQESITVELDRISPEEYKDRIKKKQYDNFHIRCLVDFKKKFKSGQVFCVTDTHSDYANQKWMARLKDSEEIAILPAQRSKSIPQDEESKKKNPWQIYYEILDKADLQTASEEEEGAF